VNNPICPACYEDTTLLPIDGLLYFNCKRCNHSFAGSSNSAIKKITKRTIFNQISSNTGLFDPFSKFNGSDSTLNKVINKFDILGGEIISNYNFSKENFSLSNCELFAECNIFESILNSHKNKKQENIISLCFMPFYDDIDQFITTCYKNVGKNNRPIVLSNTSGDFIRNTIGQVIILHQCLYTTYCHLNRKIMIFFPLMRCWVLLFINLHQS